MADVNLAIAAAIAANDAIVDRLDLGTGVTEAHILIYDGAKPAGPDTAITSQVLLAELLMSNPAFGASSDQSPNARATASAIADDAAADNSGNASWCRIVDRDGNGIIDGDVTATGGGGDLEINAVAIVAGAIVSVTAFTFDHLE